jgi:hypothetical protein
MPTKLGQEPGAGVDQQLHVWHEPVPVSTGSYPHDHESRVCLLQTGIGQPLAFDERFRPGQYQDVRFLGHPPERRGTAVIANPDGLLSPIPRSVPFHPGVERGGAIGMSNHDLGAEIAKERTRKSGSNTRPDERDTGGIGYDSKAGQGPACRHRRFGTAPRSPCAFRSAVPSLSPNPGASDGVEGGSLLSQTRTRDVAGILPSRVTPSGPSGPGGEGLRSCPATEAAR